MVPWIQREAVTVTHSRVWGNGKDVEAKSIALDRRDKVRSKRIGHGSTSSYGIEITTSFWNSQGPRPRAPPGRKKAGKKLFCLSDSKASWDV